MAKISWVLSLSGSAMSSTPGAPSTNSAMVVSSRSTEMSSLPAWALSMRSPADVHTGIAATISSMSRPTRARESQATPPSAARPASVTSNRARDQRCQKPSYSGGHSRSVRRVMSRPAAENGTLARAWMNRKFAIAVAHGGGQGDQ